MWFMPEKLSKYQIIIFARKINKIPEFYIIIARKIFFPIFFFGGGGVSYAYARGSTDTQRRENITPTLK